MSASFLESPSLMKKEFDYYQTILNQLNPYFKNSGTTLERFMVDANVALLHDKCRKRFEESLLREIPNNKKKSERTRKKFKTYNPIDVICGRGQLTNKHPGNWLFRQIVSMNKEYYCKQILEERKNVATILMQRFDQVGARFLEEKQGRCKKDCSYMILMERERVIEKFMQALREKKCNKQFVLDAIVEQLPPQKPSCTMTTTSATAKDLLKKKESLKSYLSVVKLHNKLNSAESICSTGGADNSIDSDASTMGDDLSSENEGAVALETFFGRNGTDLNRFIEGAYLQTTSQMTMSVEKYLTHKQGHADGLNTFHNTQPIDIIFGKGPVAKNHPGNVIFRHVMIMNQSFYEKLDRLSKNQAAMALVGYFAMAGTRFLEWEGHYFREVAQDRVVEKFMKALRLKHERDHSHGSFLENTVTNIKKEINKKHKRARELELPTEFDTVQESAQKKRVLHAKRPKKSKEVDIQEACDEQHIQTLLSVGHFVVHFPEDDESNIKQQEAESCTLQQVRRAFRDSIYQSTPASVKMTPDDVTPEHKIAVHQNLFNLYRPSPLRKFVSDVKTPVPVFFSDL